jgi:hypothetical protein
MPVIRQPASHSSPGLSVVFELILDPNNTTVVLFANGNRYTSNSAGRGAEWISHVIPVSESGGTVVRPTDGFPILLFEEPLFSWASDDERVGSNASCSAEHDDGSH